MTGRFLLSLTPLVKTFNTRQSSPCAAYPRSPAPIAPGAGATCGDEWPFWNASRTPVHGSTFFGGRKRFAPAVDAPYGIPRNAFTLACRTPRTLPDVVSTTGVIALDPLGAAPISVMSGKAPDIFARPRLAPKREDFSSVLRFMADAPSRTGCGGYTAKDVERRGFLCPGN